MSAIPVYVASSWRNETQPRVVAALREAGFEVYDFRHPAPGCDGFHWSEIDPKWKEWTPAEFRQGLEHPVAGKGFTQDMAALCSSGLCVLVLPCGRSAHLEAGWAAGMGQRLCILLADGEPELMYRMADHLALSIEEVVEWVKGDGRRK